jgi:hypothetical protein
VYTGRLPDGSVFDSTQGDDNAIELRVGHGQVIPGWDEGRCSVSAESDGILDPAWRRSVPFRRAR